MAILKTRQMSDLQKLSLDLYNGKVEKFSKEEGEKIGIVCNGIGHGYGLSLNYAEILAKEGHTYDEILSFFYTDIDFAKKW